MLTILFFKVSPKTMVVDWFNQGNGGLMGEHYTELRALSLEFRAFLNGRIVLCEVESLWQFLRSKIPCVALRTSSANKMAGR
jgi:hypothetical protein